MQRPPGQAPRRLTRPTPRGPRASDAPTPPIPGGRPRRGARALVPDAAHANSDREFEFVAECEFAAPGNSRHRLTIA